MTKQDVINYVMNSPVNTNKAVLSNMLDSLMDYDAIINVGEALYWNEVNSKNIVFEKGNFEAVYSKLIKNIKPKVLIKKEAIYGDNPWNVFLEATSFGVNYVNGTDNPSIDFGAIDNGCSYESGNIKINISFSKKHGADFKLRKGEGWDY